MGKFFQNPTGSSSRPSALYVALIFLVFVLPSRAQIGATRMVDVGEDPSRVAITPDGSTLYVSSTNIQTVSVIQVRAGLVHEIKLTKGPGPLAVAPDGQRVYVGLAPSGLAVISTRTESVTYVSTRVEGVPNEDGPVRDLAISRDGRFVFLAMEYAGLRELRVQDDSITVVDPTRCPEAVALSLDGTRLYISYQCAPSPGSPQRGDDPIGVFDTSEPRAGVFRTNQAASGALIPNVGGPLAVSPDGKFVWENGVDACSRQKTEKDPGGYDFEMINCPPLPPGESPENRGIVNVFNTTTKRVAFTIPFPGRAKGSTLPLGAGVPSFFPASCGFPEPRVAVPTAENIRIYDAVDGKEPDGSLIPVANAKNVVFAPDCQQAYVLNSYGGAGRLYILQIKTPPLPTSVLHKFSDWYLNQWKTAPKETTAWHTFILLAVWGLGSLTFARAFANLPYLNFPLELDLYLRKAKSQMARVYLAQLDRKLLEHRHEKNRGTGEVVCLPLRLLKPDGRVRASGEEITNSDRWLSNLVSAFGRSTSYRAALFAPGGTGKTVLLEKAMSSLIGAGCFPVFFAAVDYRGAANFDDWLDQVLRAANVPIRPSLLRAIPSLVYVIDQVSEVRVQFQDDFWSLIAAQYAAGAPLTKILIAGRDGDGAVNSISPLTFKQEWDSVEIDELQDEHIRALGAVYLDPEGKSQEVQELPVVVRRIAHNPTAFIVSSYARARRRSARPIEGPRDLYGEILGAYLEGGALGTRPDIAKRVLQRLVLKYFGTTRNRGLPPEPNRLMAEIADIFNELQLRRDYGKHNVPLPGTFIGRLLSSGLVYRTSTLYLFFHDSFEDWLVEEAKNER